MSSASPSTPAPSDLERADYLKQELMEFATKGALKEEYSRQRQIFFELSAEMDESEAASLVDWFLFDWFDENGDGVIAHFLSAHASLSQPDREILLDWEDSINSVFEIRSLGKNSLRLKELDEGYDFTVITAMSLEQTPFKRRQFIAARLLPLGNDFIFSGLQFIMPNRAAALEALEVRRALDALDSPEALENAQREQCQAFCELFDCDELTINSSELNTTLQRFQQYVFAERKDPETGLTPAERFQSEFGRELKIPEMPPLPETFASAGDLTILCDEFDGIIVLPDYSRFKRVFAARNLNKEVPDWQELVWRYIKDPDLPIVAFERVAETHSARVESVLRRLINDKAFSIEHLYALLLHYKEPVEGLEDLETDEQLWDLLNGNVGDDSARSKPRPNGRKATNSNKAKTAAARPRAAAKKSKPVAKKTTTPQARSTTQARATTKRATPKAQAATRRQATKPQAATKRQATMPGKAAANRKSQASGKAAASNSRARKAAAAKKR